MVAPLVAATIPIIGDLIDRFLPNSAEREKVKLEYEAKITEAITSVDMAQIEINKIEAAHSNMFVAGWRPACGWLGVFGLAYHAILQPFFMFLTSLAGYKVDLPVFDTSVLMTLLVGMLGMGTLRSYDKKNETDTKVILPWIKRNKDL
jgi:hypothetical protein